MTETTDSSESHSPPTTDSTQPYQSVDSLNSLSNKLSRLTLAPKRYRKGQFGYIPEPETPTPSTESSLSRTASSLFEPRNHTTPTTSPAPVLITPLPTHSDSDDEMPANAFFWGDNRDHDPVPGNFLKTVSSGFKETSSDAFKAKQLANGFATNSVAETWFEDLPAATQNDWDLLEAAFKLRWPKEVVIAITVEQRRARLRAEKLAKEDVGVLVMVNGVEMTGQARWANKILALSALAEDPSCASLHSIREGMPDIMKKLVKGEFKTWATFCTAVKAVSDDEVETTISEEKRITAIEQESKRLRAQLAIQQSPTAPLRSAFGGFNINRPRPPTAPPLTEAQFFQSGTMGRNNLFQAARNPEPNPQHPPAAPRTNTGFRANHLRHADLSANTKDMVHHNDTPAGQAAYREQVAEWKRANPQKQRGGDEYTPYPLTPGTLPVGTGECHTCGLRHPVGTPHLRAEVDPFETTYRRIAGHIIRTSRNTPASTNPPVNVQYIAATTPEYLNYLSTYNDEQGNGDGPAM